jgi:hypothetical protein
MKTALSVAGALFSLLLSANTFAQSILEARCYTAQSVFNAYYIDGYIAEYGIIAEGAYYVAVIDPVTCMPWKTNYDGDGHDFGNYNTGRPRAEQYFVFRYDNEVELDGMATLLNAAPEGAAILVYTPASYNYSEVYDVNETLATTLFEKWGAAAQENQIMVLYGVQGQPATFVTDMSVDQNDGNGDYISFTTALGCAGAAAGLEVNAVSELTVTYTGNGQLLVNTDGTPEDLMLIDPAGRELPFTANEKVLTAKNGLSPGTYIVCGTLNGRSWSRKVAVAW